MEPGPSDTFGHGERPNRDFADVPTGIGRVVMDVIAVVVVVPAEHHDGFDVLQDKVGRVFAEQVLEAESSAAVDGSWIFTVGPT